jgi:hypothetical protein
MKLKVSTFEQVISSASLGNNSIQINQEIKNAFNNSPAGTIFTPSIAVTYSDTGSEILTPTAIPNYVPKKITPSLSLSDIPDKLTTDASFSIASLVSKTGTGVLSYSSSNTSVASVNSSTGQVTIVGAGTTSITVSLAASADQVYSAATPVSKTLTVSLPTSSVPAWTQRGADIDGEAASDFSGGGVSLSADGNILAIGASGNDASGNLLSNAGHVRVYQYDATKTTAQMDQSLPNYGPVRWNRLGGDIDGEGSDDYSGISLSLSADGTILAIGGRSNNANIPNTIDGDGNIIESDVGHVRVYQYDATKTTAQMDQSLPNFGPVGWNRLGADIDGKAAGDKSGWSVSLSADGSIVAIGAVNNTGNVPTQDEYGNILVVGHVRVYQWNQSSSLWEQIGQDIDGEAIGYGSGYSLALSSNGNTVAIGTPDNYESENLLRNIGYVCVYDYDGSQWIKRGSNIYGKSLDDHSGYSVSLSSDGNIVAIGAPSEFFDFTSSGHVRVYYWDTLPTPNKWTQLGQDINGEAATDLSGYSVSLSSDGFILAIGAPSNDDNFGALYNNARGHVRVYEYNGTSWVQRGADIDGEAASDLSGWRVSLSADGSIVAIGAVQNAGNGSNSGHVRVYEYE